MSRVRSTRLLLLAALVVQGGPASAQDAPAPPAPAAQPAPEPKVVTDPTVQLLLDSNLATPADQLRAISVMIDLTHGFAAKPILQKVIDARLDVKSLAALVERFGTAAFMKIALEPELQPEGAQFAKAAIDASSLASRDPGRIAQLIDELKTASPAKQITLTARLREARSAAVGPLLTVLADEAQAAAHPQMRLAILALGDDALPPLWGALELPDDRRLAAIRLLGELGNRQSIGPLLSCMHRPREGREGDQQAAAEALVSITGTTPSIDAAVTFLTDKAERLYASSFLPESPDAAPVEYWSAADNELKNSLLPPAQAALRWAARLAHDARAMAPAGNARVDHLAKATLFALAGSQLDGAAAAKIDPNDPALAGVLAESLAAGHWATAEEAARLLGTRTTPSTLYEHQPEVSPLVNALRYGDERTRFAALSSIVKLKPVKTFPGSSYVADSLAHFISGWGLPRAVVIHSDLNKAEELRNLLIGAGYDTDVSDDVRDLVRLARSSADYELAVVDISVPFPTVNDALAELRRDGQTAQVLVAIVAPPERLDEARRIAARYPLAEGFIRPHTTDALSFELAQLAALDRRAVPRDVRQAHGQAAVAMLAELSAQDRSAIDTTAALAAALDALYRPEVAQPAADALATWGTNAAQRALADAASLVTHPLELRRVAARALRRSLAEHGIRLTAAEIQTQYDRYNASEHLDAETQAVLTSILDAIETRAFADEEAEGIAPPRPEARDEAR